MADNRAMLDGLIAKAREDGSFIHTVFQNGGIVDPVQQDKYMQCYFESRLSAEKKRVRVEQLKLEHPERYERNKLNKYKKNRQRTVSINFWIFALYKSY